MTKYQKDDDPYCWKEHEIGHILGHRKGFDSKSGNPIEDKDIIKHYPNSWNEYYPFLLQMKKLLLSNNENKTIRKIMVDYEESQAHKGNLEDLNAIEKFCRRFIKKYVKI